MCTHDEFNCGDGLPSPWGHPRGWCFLAILSQYTFLEFLTTIVLLWQACEVTGQHPTVWCAARCQLQGEKQPSDQVLCPLAFARCRLLSTTLLRVGRTESLPSCIRYPSSLSHLLDHWNTFFSLSPLPLLFNSTSPQLHLTVRTTSFSIQRTAQ